MSLEQRVTTLEHQQSETNERFDCLEEKVDQGFAEMRQGFAEIRQGFAEMLESNDKQFAEMREFNQQTQDLVRVIYFAVKHEEPPK